MYETGCPSKTRDMTYAEIASPFMRRFGDMVRDNDHTTGATFPPSPQAAAAEGAR